MTSSGVNQLRLPSAIAMVANLQSMPSFLRRTSRLLSSSGGRSRDTPLQAHAILRAHLEHMPARKARPDAKAVPASI